MLRYSLVMAGLLTVAACTVVAAQEAVLAQLYGQGVHAYFAQDFVKAHELLSSAIDRGTHDPRVYYFRGLALQRLGRPEDAQADFSTGAEREAKDLNKFYNVSKALERVQGHDRVALERHRVEARVAAMEEAQRIMQARYEQRREAERHVLAGPPETVKPSEIKPVKPIDTSSNDPFGAPAAGATEPADPPQEPAVTPKPAENDPFGAPAAKPEEPADMPAEKPAERPAENDPFGTPATKPEEPAAMPAEKPAENDPFGAPAAKPEEPAAMPAEKPAENDPFGAPAAGGGMAPSSEAKPKGIIFRAFQRAAGKALGGGTENSSATQPAAPSEALPPPQAGSMPAEPTTAPDAVPGAAPSGNIADPFGEAKPAAAPAVMPKPADDDPFGGSATPAAPAGGDQMDAPAADNPFAPEKPANADTGAMSDEQPAPADTPKPPQSSKPADPDDPFAN